MIESVFFIAFVAVGLWTAGFVFIVAYRYIL